MAFFTALAVLVALFADKLWKFIDRPKLQITFRLKPPSCHKTGAGNSKTPVYYFRFIVKNCGKTQAENCEVFLEKIMKKDETGKYNLYKNFTPVNLKWSGIREPFKRTLYSSKKMYCDLGKVIHPTRIYKSQYVNVTAEEQSLSKFIFELPEVYYSQWDCLIPGKYILTVSVYSKNAKKVTRKFNLTWSGNWEDEDKDMFKELIIT